MDTTFSEVNGVLVVAPKDHLDTSNSTEVEKEILKRIESVSSRVVFDFQSTEYVSSAGLRVVLKASKMANKKGGNLSICRANRHIQEVFELSGFLQFINQASSLDNALKET